MDEQNGILVHEAMVEVLVGDCSNCAASGTCAWTRERVEEWSSDERQGHVQIICAACGKKNWFKGPEELFGSHHTVDFDEWFERVYGFEPMSGDDYNIHNPAYRKD